MFEDSCDGGGEAALARLDAVLDQLIGLTVDRCTDDEVLALLRGLETRVRRLAVVDHALLAQVDNRGLAREHAATSTVSFVARLLRVSTGEARARVTAARHLAARQVAGQVLKPEYPVTAAASAEGAISPGQARVVCRTLQHIPAGVRDEQFDTLETQLVGWAREFGPDQLAQLGRRLHDVLDPDGVLRDSRYRDRCRDFTVRQRPDGSVSGSFEGTAELGEALLTVLDKTAAPTPASDGAKDPRTAGQRRHDGLLDALKLLLRAGELGETNGVSTTIIVTMTDQQLQTGEGLATTGHGASIPVRDAVKHLGDARIFPVSLLATKPITSYGTTHRIFTEGQRLAMIARDQGCSFPGCTTGPAWTEAHHMTDWQLTNRTSVDDGALLCGFHHREFEQLGWRGQMINGLPHWLAPYWLDPDQTWQRNTAHDAAALV